LFPIGHKVRHRAETKACFWNCLCEATKKAGVVAVQEGDQPVTYRFSRGGLRTAVFALLFGSTLLLLPFAPAEAAAPERARPAAAQAEKTKLAEADPATTSSLAKAVEDEPACARPRRRLWVEGEGWVVRRVSACH
jgi:hypothetical protein